MSHRNINLPKTPIIYQDGIRMKFRPECSECGLVANVASPKEWIYKEGGYVCLECQIKDTK